MFVYLSVLYSSKGRVHGIRHTAEQQSKRTNIGEADEIISRLDTHTRTHAHTHTHTHYERTHTVNAHT